MLHREIDFLLGSRTLEYVSERFQFDYFVCFLRTYFRLDQLPRVSINHRNNRYKFPPLFSGIVQDDHQIDRV